MTQIATVTAVPAPGVALVSVARQTACGHDCENCPGCGVQGTSITVRARTELPVEPGDTFLTLRYDRLGEHVAVEIPLPEVEP